MAQVIVSVGRAVKYAVANSFKRPLRWLLISLLYLAATLAAAYALMQFSGALVAGFQFATILGIAASLVALFIFFFFAGLVQQILVRQEITFRKFRQTVGRGCRSVLVYLIYAILPFTLSALVVIATSESAGSIGDRLAGCGLWILLPALLLILYGFFVIPAQVNLACRDRFAAAFAVREIAASIKKAGCLSLIAGLIVWLVVGAAFSLVITAAGSALITIPYAGVAFSLLVTSFLSFFLMLYAADYWTEFFAVGRDSEDY